MAVAVFAVIYSNVLTDDGPELENFATISGTLANVNGDNLQDIVFDLNRGDSLGTDTEVFIDLGFEDKTFDVTVEGNLVEYSSNANWNIGDIFVYHPRYEDGTLINLNRLNVKANIIDKKTNSLVFWGTLQEGWIHDDLFGGIWRFDELDPYNADELYEYSGTEKDVLDDLNGNDGIARGGTNHADDAVSGPGSCFFPGIRDSDVLVEDHYSLNIQDEITIEAWMKPYDEGFIRTTSGYKAQFGFNPDVVNVCGDIYAIAADGKTDDCNGWAVVATTKIGTNGKIEEIIDTNNPLKLDYPGQQPDIIQVYSDGEYNYYAVVYSGAASNNYAGSLMEIKINKATGVMDFVSSERQEIDFPNSVCWPDIIKVDDNIYFVVYSDETTITKDGDIYLIRIELDEISGEINPESEKILIGSGNDPSIIKISDKIYAITYGSSESGGYIRTFEIDSMTDSITQMNDAQRFDGDSEDVSAIFPDIIHLEGNTYAICYSNWYKNSGGDEGLITTLDIDPSTGFIPSFKLVRKVFDSEYCVYPDITNVKDDLYAIVYSTGSGAGSDSKNGRIVTLDIRDLGATVENINLIIDKFYDPNEDKDYKCDSPVFAMISENIFAVIYESGTPHMGQISTFCLVDYPETPFERGIFKSGSVNIYAVNNPHGEYSPGVYASVKIFDAVTNEESEYNLHTSDMYFNDWNHIALTFDGKDIILYCNGNAVETETVKHPENENLLKTSNSDLKFGYLFFGLIDEISIIDEVLIFS